MKFPPINLWSKPVQLQYEDAIAEVRCRDLTVFSLLELAEQVNDEIIKNMEKANKAQDRARELNFIYYCRTGRFLDE